MTTEPATLRKNLWKTLLPVGVILVLIVVGLKIVQLQFASRKASPGGASSAVVNETGSVVPDFVLSRFGGGTVRLSELKSKVTLINFWATWCEACVEEMPSIVKLHNAYKDKGFGVLAVNLDDNPDAVIPKALKQLGIDFPVYIDPDGKLASVFDVHAIPLTAIIDKDRKVLMLLNGGRDWNTKDIQTQVEKWLSP